MERLRRTVVQLGEAKRFIMDGEVARLRLAVGFVPDEPAPINNLGAIEIARTRQIH